MLDSKLARRILVIPFVFAMLTACSGNDSALDKAVQDRLADEGVPNQQIKTTTVRRVVKLEGVVSDTSELNRAEIAARSVKGVIGVDNQLVVKPQVDVTGATLPSYPTIAPTSPTDPPAHERQRSR